MFSFIEYLKELEEFDVYFFIYYTFFPHFTLDNKFLNIIDMQSLNKRFLLTYFEIPYFFGPRKMLRNTPCG